MTRALVCLIGSLLLGPLAFGQGAAAPGGGPVKQVGANGARLTYVERGEGEPVVFIHGALGDYRTWGPQVEVFSPRYRAISYSRRFHHPEGMDEGGPAYTRQLHAADLAALLRALDLGPAHLVGHSYGGALAGLVAAEHPELVRSVVLAEPSLFSVLRGPEEKALLAENRREAGERVLPPVRVGADERAVRAYLRLVVGADVLDGLPAESRAVIMQNARTLGPMLRTYFDPTPLDCERARGVTVPVLLVRGELSPEINRRVAESLDRCLPNAEVFVLRGASHGLQMEKPAEFNAAVLKFIGRHGRVHTPGRRR